MATPLHQLVDAVMFDPAERELFRQAPETYLRTAGYSDLDASDVQEAMYILADGAHPERAELLLTGGRAIGEPSDVDDVLLTGDVGVGDARAGFEAALDAVPLEIGEIDGMDGMDGIDEPTLTSQEPSDEGPAGLDGTFGSGAGDSADTDGDAAPTPDTTDRILHDEPVSIDDPLSFDVGPDPDIDEFGAGAPSDPVADDEPDDWHDLES